MANERGRIGARSALVAFGIASLAGCILSGFDNVDCEPGATMPCYSGPAGTEGVGLCRAGQKTCNDEGDGWSDCANEVLPRPENCATPGDEDCNGVACSDPIWGERFGDIVDQIAQSVAVDRDGNVLVGGVFSGVLAFASTNLVAPPMEGGLFLAKLDPSGRPLWARMIAHGQPYGDCNAGCQRGQIVIAISGTDHVFVGGSFTGTLDLGDGAPQQNTDGVPDAFVGELSGQTGVGVWSKAYPSTGGDAYATAIAANPSGGVIATGYFHGSIDLGAGALNSGGPTDGFLLKLDDSGTPVWSERIGIATADELPFGVAVDPTGHVALTGAFDNTTNLGGASLMAAGGADLFVARFDSLGNHLWSKGFGGTGSDYAVTIATDANGRAIIAGYADDDLSLGGGMLPAASPGMFDVILAKFDVDGTPLWSRRYGDPATQIATGVALDGSGNIVLVGGAIGSIDFGGGPLAGGGEVGFVAKFDAAGNPLWSRGVNPPSAAMMDVQAFTSVATDRSGNIVGAGFFKGRMQVGPTTLTSAGGADAFVAKFMP